MKTERNRRDLREKAERYLKIIAELSYEAHWEKAMDNAHKEIGAGCFRAARKFINAARNERQFCKQLPT